MRADQEIPEKIIEKSAYFCGVKPDHVIPAPTVDTIYRIPLDYQARRIGDLVLDQLQLTNKGADMNAWENLYNHIKASTKEVRIAMVGKYVDLEDAYYSLNE